jgi:hypothetical protein
MKHLLHCRRLSGLDGKLGPLFALFLLQLTTQVFPEKQVMEISVQASIFMD